MPGDVVFLDANVLFSAAYRPDTGVRRLWQLPEVTLTTSAYAVAEARRNLTTPARQAALNDLLSSVQVHAVLVASPDPRLAQIDLPIKDLPIVEAAIKVGATHLLTGDVRHFGAFYGQHLAGVLILRPATYLKMVASS